jgi:hypothetical protein
MEMTHIDTGTYGAKRQSWKGVSPRDLLKRMIDSNPGVAEETLQEKFAARVENEPDYLAPIIEYWFANNYRSLVHSQPQVRVGRREARKAQDDVVKQTIIARAPIVLLDLAMPNGKSLRDCTGKDCAKAGGWLAKLAAKVKPAQKVGDALSEKEVRALFGSR